MRVLGKLAAVIIGVSVFSVAPGIAKAEQITIQQQITITSKVASRVYLIVDKDNQIKEIFSNSNTEPEVVSAMSDHLGGPAVLIDQNIKSQYEYLKPHLSFSYGTIYKQGQVIQLASEVSYNNLPQKNYESLLQNIGIKIFDL